MFKSLNKLGTGLSKAVDQVGKDINKTIDENWKSTLLDNFRTGNVVQLISRSSGHSLQIVTAPTGQLVVDGLGPIGPQYMHAHWTVLNEGKNIVRLYNQNNYIAIVNGNTCIMQFPDPSLTTPETRLRLHQTGNFVTFESVQKIKEHIGILREGTLKPAMATGTEIDAQFGVQVVYSPYAPPPGAAAGPVKK